MITRVAVLSDIHGNIPALEAVIEDIKQKNVDEIIVAGDLVGRGPCGEQVVDRIQELQWKAIRGNHEDYMINFAKKQIPESWLTDEYWIASRWMSSRFSAQQIEYIDVLPDSIQPESTNLLHIVHGTPFQNNKGIGPWTSEETLQTYLQEQPPSSVLVCAHTHRPFITQQQDNKFIVNIGSVGLPFNTDPRAQYAIFTCDTEQKTTTVALQQVYYDREKILKIYEQSGFLNDAGFTSFLLQKEIEVARPFLVPFLRWSDQTQQDPCQQNTLEMFLDLYNPHLELDTFLLQFL